MSAPGRFALASRSPGFTGARESTSRSKPWDPSNQVLCWTALVPLVHATGEIAAWRAR